MRSVGFQSTELPLMLDPSVQLTHTVERRGYPGRSARDGNLAHRLPPTWVRQLLDETNRYATVWPANAVYLIRAQR